MSTTKKPKRLITIRMPRGLRKKWLEALRGQRLNPKTGKPYEQGRGVLERDNKFCCIGVLADIAGASTTDKNGGRRGLMSMHQLARLGIQFTGTPDTGINGAAVNPDLSTDREIRDEDYNCAVNCNDNKRLSFKRIADRIEKRSVGY